MDEHEFDNAKQVSVATNLTNLKILSILAGEQLNVSELATRLGISSAIANYHVKQLEDVGLVYSLGEDNELGRDRQRFASVANKFRLEMDTGSMSEAEWLRSIATFRRNFEEAIQKWELSTTRDWPYGKNKLNRYGLANVKVSPQRHKEMVNQISQLLNEFIGEEDYEGPDAVEAILLCLFFPSQE